MDYRKRIANGQAILGIELGSTRIKAVLIDKDSHETLVTGTYDWENCLLDGYWTYDLDLIWKGIQASYKDLKDAVKNNFDLTLSKVASMGISGMMHGYMVFDEKNELLVPFRTWRNNLQEDAASQLTNLFGYPIPQRWSIAHLYQAILNGEDHVASIDFQTTLAGYIHWQLTGRKVIGVGEASGMFPIDIDDRSFSKKMIGQFNQLVSDKEYPWTLESILPEVLYAGESAGVLSVEGSLLIDPSGELEIGVLLCPPEGDAGTGMVATNSVAKRTGNVSAGTSVFAMVVLEKELSKVYEEIDQVTTPDGSLVAMVHSNNCTSNLDSWMKLFEEAGQLLGATFNKDKLYTTLYSNAMKGDADGGGLVSIGYLSGEHMTHFSEGRPLFVRQPDSAMNLSNFIRVNLYTALGALKIGMDILFKEEKVVLNELLGHGGFFKVLDVGNRVMAAAMNVPVTLMDNAGEGGSWGMAVLASYMLNKDKNQSLSEYLNEYVFKELECTTFQPISQDVDGFEQFMERYKKALDVERAAVDYL